MQSYNIIQKYQKKITFIFSLLPRLLTLNSQHAEP